MRTPRIYRHQETAERRIVDTTGEEDARRVQESSSDRETGQARTAGRRDARSAASVLTISVFA